MRGPAAWLGATGFGTQTLFSHLQYDAPKLTPPQQGHWAGPAPHREPPLVMEHPITGHRAPAARRGPWPKNRRRNPYDYRVGSRAVFLNALGVVSAGIFGVGLAHGVEVENTEQ